MSKSLRILLAPDSFKGSLSATQFCNIAKQEIENVHPNATVLSYPLSDGGEGFIDCFIDTGLAEAQSMWVSGPLGKRTKAYFAWQPDTHTAIIEMAQASGLTKLRHDELDPLNTHSHGTGQLIQEAIKLGAKKIILGLGGSATNDGGAGALMALGIPLLNFKGQEINLGGQALKQLHHVGEVPEHLLEIEWLIASDVTNPLLGPEGASHIFAPQKGANPRQVQLLEEAMINFAKILEEHANKDIHSLPGAGAAGGVAAGFMGILNAKLMPGFDLINDTFNLEHVITNNDIDYIFTGEGRFDHQTKFGKLPLRMAQLGQRMNVPTIGICGSLKSPVEELPEFQSIFSIVNSIMNEEEAMANAPFLLSQTVKSIAPMLK